LVKHFIGVEPWFVLSFIAYIVAYLAYLGLGKTTLPDWAGAALLARKKIGISGAFKAVN